MWKNIRLGSIQKDSNSQPLDCESPPLTTKPKSMKNNLQFIRLYGNAILLFLAKNVWRQQLLEMSFPDKSSFYRDRQTDREGNQTPDDR